MKPRLSVNMMVLNGASVLERALSPLMGIAEELVVVDTGSTDDTYEAARYLATKFHMDFQYERFDTLFPQCFVKDDSSTWDDLLPGPFTGRPLCIDWAAPRNRALKMSTGTYVLKLDADDEIMSGVSGDLITLMEHMDCLPHLQEIVSPYEIMDGDGHPELMVWYNRLWRRDSRIYFANPIHERIFGVEPANSFKSYALMVRDHRDSCGEGVRLHLRNFKVLFWHYLKNIREHHCERNHDYEFLYNFGVESSLVFPEISRAVWHEILHRWPSDQSLALDAHYHLARAFEAENNYPEAIAAYERSANAQPNARALLCGGKLHQVNGQEALAKSWYANALNLTAEVGRYYCDLKLLAEAESLRKS